MCLKHKLKKTNYDFVNSIQEPDFMERIFKINENYETETKTIYKWKTN